MLRGGGDGGEDGGELGQGCEQKEGGAAHLERFPAASHFFSLLLTFTRSRLQRLLSLYHRSKK